MDLINRYTYAVTKLLPASQQKEVEDELQSNIQDMVDAAEGPRHERVRKVLETLGRPEVLAMKYTDVKPYLIGPEWWAAYIRSFKAIVTVATAVALLIATTSHWTTDESILGKVISILLGTANGTILAAFGVTAIFVFFERSQSHESRHNEIAAWSVDDLPQLPAKYRSRKH